MSRVEKVFEKRKIKKASIKLKTLIGYKKKEKRNKLLANIATK